MHAQTWEAGLRAGFGLFRCGWLGLGSLLATAGIAAVPVTGPATPGFEHYDREFAALLERWQIPGAALAVAVDGRIAYARGFGLADPAEARIVQPDTRFRVGSVSKTLTAAAVLRLIEEGRLSLDARVFPLLGYPTPGYPGATRDPRLDSVTVRQVLAHTAGWRKSLAEIPFSGGLRGFDPIYAQREIAQFLGTPTPPSAETIVRGMVGQPLQAVPGSAYEYSSFGYVVLGRVIERITGLNYAEATRRALAECGVGGLLIGGSRRSELAADESAYVDFPGAPIGASHLEDAAVPRPYCYSMAAWDASGGWTISAIEAVRFLLALDGLNGTPRLLSPASVAAMRTEQFAGSSYGYGWALYRSYAAGEAGGHAGGWHGTASWLLRSADGRVHWAALFNSRPANDAAFFEDAFNILVSEQHHLSPPARDLTWSTLGWEAWRQRWPGAGAESPLADLDADGLPDLVEYAGGLDPTHCDTEPPVTFASRPDGTPVLGYRRLLLEHPLTWSVESSSGGQEWTGADGPAAETTVNVDGTLSVRVPVPTAARARVHLLHRPSGAEVWMEPQRPAQNLALRPGESATLSVIAPPGAVLQWRRNGVAIAAAVDPALTVRNVQPGEAGIYTVDVDGGRQPPIVAAVVGVRPSTKVTGAAQIVQTGVQHPNGNVYDQVLLTGEAATITAEPGRITRLSYVDLDEDIVQVEFSGSGSLTVVLADAAGPALPLNYHQDVRYMKGHATIVVTDADANTHVSVFSVGKGNAVNQALFKSGVAYDGIADVAALAIQSSTGRAAGVYLGNAHFFAAEGLAGVYAAGVAVSGPVRVGDLSAFDGALPALVFGSAPDVMIAGGDLAQGNGRALEVRGFGVLRMAAGSTSGGIPLLEQPNRATLKTHGLDVSFAPE